MSFVSACLAAATGGQGSSLLGAPATSPVASGRSRWPSRKHASASLGSVWPAGTLNSGLWTFAASAPLSADTARPHRNAPQFCPLQPAPRPAPSALPLSVPLSHTPRPAGRDNTAVTALSLWPGRRPCPGVSVGSRPLPAPAQPVPSHAVRWPLPKEPKIPAR